jgi:hypothetical protein
MPSRNKSEFSTSDFLGAIGLLVGNRGKIFTCSETVKSELFTLPTKWRNSGLEAFKSEVLTRARLRKRLPLLGGVPERDN